MSSWYAEYPYSAYLKCESKNSEVHKENIIVAWLHLRTDALVKVDALNLLNLIYFGFGNRHPCHYSFLKNLCLLLR